MSASVSGLRQCQLCNKKLKNEDGVKQHKLDKHPRCPECNCSFMTEHKLTKHKRRLGHCFCSEHDKVFDCKADLREHKRKEPHVTEFTCLICKREFTTQQGFEDHLKAKKHPADNVSNAAASPEDQPKLEGVIPYCQPCKRQFANVDHLSQHNDSVRHNPLSNLKCPFSIRCSKKFTSPSALIFHFENGCCKSGISRSELNTLILEHDIDGQITDKENVARTGDALNPGACIRHSMSFVSGTSSSKFGDILTPTESDESTSTTGSGVILTMDEDALASTLSANSSCDSLWPSVYISRSRIPSVDSVAVTPAPTDETLSDWAFITNDRQMIQASVPVTRSSADTVASDTADECWQCPECNRRFEKEFDLLSHIDSPVHAPKIFHCPTAALGLRNNKRNKRFKTLSGLAQHIEMGACIGGKGILDRVVRIFESKIKAVTGMEMKLLCNSTKI